MEIHVIRHTHVAIEKDTCYGQYDVDVSSSFLEELENIKKQLPNDFDAIYCSPLIRCTKLASSLNFTNIIIENDLMEMNFGDWENKKWDEINQKQLDKWMNDFVNIKPQNGENLLELSLRINSFLEKLRKKQHKKVLIITHSGVIRCIWAYVLEIQLKNIFKIPIEFNEVFVAELAKKREYDKIVRLK